MAEQNRFSIRPLLAGVAAAALVAAFSIPGVWNLLAWAIALAAMSTLTLLTAIRERCCLALLALGGGASAGILLGIVAAATDQYLVLPSDRVCVVVGVVFVGLLAGVAGAWVAIVLERDRQRQQ